VCINRLEQAERNPDVDGEDVQVLREPAVQQRSANRASAQNQNLSGVRILGSETKGRAVLVVDLVNVPVERAVVQSLMGKVMKGVLKDEEEGDLGGHGLPAGEGNLPGLHAAGLSKGVEEPDLGELDRKMREKDELGAFPLLFCRRNFALQKSELRAKNKRRRGLQAAVSIF
jgi:hypothetical protein